MLFVEQLKITNFVFSKFCAPRRSNLETFEKLTNQRAPSEISSYTLETPPFYLAVLYLFLDFARFFQNFRTNKYHHFIFTNHFSFLATNLEHDQIFP